MPAHATPQAHLYVDTPTAIFKARVAMPGTITYPVTTLIYDTVTLGAFGDIQVDMLLTLGTAEGLDDLGRTRVKGLALASTIPLGRISQGVEDGTLYVSDNSYITVYADWRVWAKLPYIDTSIGVDYKDGDIVLGDFDTEQPPVAIGGPHFADYINAGTSLITVSFDASSSYAVADGATITTYAWNVGDGTITVGTTATAAITATFPAGKRWVWLTVTDSNGKTNSRRIFVLAVNPASDVTVPAWGATQRLTQNMQTLDVQLYSSLPRTSYPDGALVLLWWDAPATPADRSHMKFAGWLQSESFALRATRTGLAKDTVLRCVDVAGRLDTLPGFPQALVREEEEGEDLQWSLMPSLDMSKALHYLLQWHSTALTVADFFLPANGSDYPTMALLMGGATLHDQVSSLALQLTPDHILACNSTGQLSVLEDWMLVDVGDRPASSSILTEDDYSELSVDYHRPPRVHVLRGSAVIASTDWIQVAGVDTLPLAFAIAPGDAFSQGTSEQQEAEGLTISQAALNTATGHKYARLNARFGLARLKLPAPDAWDYEPALLNRIQLNIAATYAAQRGLPFTQVNTQVKELNIRYVTDKTGTWIDPELTLEFETSGFAAVTQIPDDAEPVTDPETPEPDDTETEVPDYGLIEGVEDVAGISMDGFVYRTDDFQTVSGSGGPTWDEVDLSTGAIYSFVVDPFSPGYILGVGTVDGWVVSETDIYRVDDLFGTPTATSVHTFAVANDMAEFHWRTIQASFGAFFAEGVNPWLVCISYYGDTVGHTGTWCTYSVDGGATWAAEVQVSAHYSTATGISFQPIAVYTSPKTPGLAYTTAHIKTETRPRTDAYVTYDWGATWARLASIPADSVAEPLPHWGLFYEGGAAAVTVGGFFRGGAVELAAGGVDASTHDYRFLFAPHADTVRAVLDCHWEAGRAQDTSSGGTAGQTLSFSITHKAGEVGMVETMDYDSPGTNSATFEDFTVTWTRSVGKTEWNGHRDELAGELADPTDAEYCRWLSTPNAVKSGNAKSEVSIELTATVTELELENGHIYAPGAEAGGLIQPGYGRSGTIHIPWPDNAAENLAYYGNYHKTAFRQFRLYRNAAEVATDISPSDGTRSYGVGKGMFGVRTLDSNRQYVLLAGTGNDTTGFANGDWHGVWTSIDYGDTWTELVAPQASDGSGRDGFEAAYSPDDPDIIFIYGPEEYISYTSDGSTVDDRSGNLSSLSPSGWIGIAGGPTG